LARPNIDVNQQIEFAVWMRKNYHCQVQKGAQCTT
jgi:hypothetical protein